MWITSSKFEEGGRIPIENAFGAPSAEGKIQFSDNKNPDLEWGGVPPGSASFVITCIDADVPSVGDDVNQEGREVPADLPRTTFTHWLLVDIPATTRDIAEGAYSTAVVPGGQPGASGAHREGINDFTGWFAGDPEMAGVYRGYDGPCPPWNDTIVHHYEFSLFALDVPSLVLGSDFTVTELEAAMSGHVLERASIVGTYVLNPRLLAG